MNQQCKTGREWEHYQSEDSNPTQPTHIRKNKKENSRRYKEQAYQANRKALALVLKPASPTPSNRGSPRSLQRDTQRAQRFSGTVKSYSEETSKAKAFYSSRPGSAWDFTHMRLIFMNDSFIKCVSSILKYWRNILITEEN